MADFNKKQKEYMNKQLRNQYEHLCAIFGIGSRSWTELHRRPSIYAFCPANQKSMIAEYLLLEEFAAEAKAWDVPYYYGIDEFLESYHDVVYKRVKIDEE